MLNGGGGGNCEKTLHNSSQLKHYQTKQFVTKNVGFVVVGKKKAKIKYE